MKRFLLLILFLGFTIIVNSQGYKNLVLEGGGVRGIAYVGALQELDEKGILSEIERVSGTSAGAITATLLAVGYSPQELYDEITSKKVQDFNDGKGLFVGGTMRLNEYYGWYMGEEIRDWINELIVEKTGINDMTFSDLHILSEKLDEYKELYVHATNLSLQKAEILSFETYPNMKLADAIRISSSIPLYYTAAFMDSTGNVYINPESTEGLYVMSDGGFIANYPIKTFDFSRYNPVVSELGYNPETVGLRLEREEQIKADQNGTGLVEYEIEEVKDYISAFYNLVIESLNRCDMDDCDWERTISIDTKGIGPKVRKMSEEERQLLVDSGREGVKIFLE